MNSPRKISEKHAENVIFSFSLSNAHLIKEAEKRKEHTRNVRKKNLQSYFSLMK